jgi:hypothetical protein
VSDGRARVRSWAIVDASNDNRRNGMKIVVIGARIGATDFDLWLAGETLGATR